MSFFDKIIAAFQPVPESPDVRFGRFSDAYKTVAQQEAWNQSQQLFEDGRALEAYVELFRFYKDEHTDNITWSRDEKGLHFRIRQGSRLITGTANGEFVRAESRIARTSEPNVAFMRRLAEQNFRLRYSRFAISPENELTIVFDSFIHDGAPYKINQALRELALQADKHDDILLDEFAGLLQPIHEPSFKLAHLPPSEKDTKIAYLRHQIKAIFDALALAKPEPSRYPGGYVYLMLGTAFRLDYLVRPEGFTMDAFEKIFQTYFAKDDKTPFAKVEALRRIYQKILDRTDEQLQAELYLTTATFGLNNSAGYEQIKTLIDAELPKMDWHMEQNQPLEMQMAIPHYIVGYALFHFSPQAPVKAWLELFLRITENRFFQDLGFVTTYWTTDGALKKNAIEKSIRDIAGKWNATYPGFVPGLQTLDYTNLPRFARSYIKMIRHLQS